VALALDGEGGIVLRPTRRRYELSELVARITPKNRHRETDWGQPQGEESW
jgi:antitoxin MazE